MIILLSIITLTLTIRSVSFNEVTQIKNILLQKRIVSRHCAIANERNYQRLNHSRTTQFPQFITINVKVGNTLEV